MNRPSIAQVRRMIVDLEAAMERMAEDPDIWGTVHDLRQEASAAVLALQWVAGDYGADGRPVGLAEMLEFEPDR